MFKLNPQRPKSSPSEQIGSLASLLATKNETDARRLLDRAVQAFRDATVEDKTDRSSKMSKAVDLLSSARAMNPADHTPSLLLTHALLGKRRFLSATLSLVSLVQRYPEVFVDNTNIAAYCGDVIDENGTMSSKWLRDQMRAILTAPTRSSEGTSARALRAYAAWVLGDRVRSVDALDELNTLNRGPRANEQLVRFAVALGAAVR